MRALVQRVASARVVAGGEVVGAIGRGLLVLVGMHRDDTPADGAWMGRKLLSLRVFEDARGKMSRSVEEVNGELLIVSQFTLYGDARQGARPDFGAAMPTEAARTFYEEWIALLRRSCALPIREGRFAATMQVELVNDGPVTLMLDSR
ncbi:MAG: D-tyrosyl-tRNA(Tyr) deacylase [Verrucomicrobiae bacterium]|nr:D-tyrosyl-tRNA(Tyr) deacylase [Verrucomicrobiae bacterium]